MLFRSEEITPKKTTQEIADEINKGNNIMNEQKLILDQPDTVTTKGKVEHIVAPQQPIQPLNDAASNQPQADVLLTENPLDGVAIIKG